MRRYHAQGLTAQEVVDLLRDEGIKVTRGTVDSAWSRMGLSGTRAARYYEDIPWRVKIAHAGHDALRRLRNVGRMRIYMTETHPEYKELFDRWITGRELSERDKQQIDSIAQVCFPPEWRNEYTRFANWWPGMRERAEVVHYTREAGVMIVPARPGKDLGFIRVPDEESSDEPPVA